VIFMTTAHRGSRLARQPGVRLGVRLIRRNNPLLGEWDLLEGTNGTAIFQPFFQNRPLSSVDGIEAENPLIMALDSARIAPTVTYHSIIANIHPGVPPEKTSDGLITYASAHIDGTASEQIITSGHACESDSEAIAEVQRILLVHLDELEGRTGH
jgi:hypothetical protein